MLSFCSFETPLGFWAMAGAKNKVATIRIGYATASKAEIALKASLTKYKFETTNSLVEEDWLPQLRTALLDFTHGVDVDFTSFDILWPPLTNFKKKVLEATRQIPYGETTSYKELAALAGHPGAARAVGSVMANNALPILIPCHRVLAAGHRLGGYSTPQGLNLKKKILKMENPTVELLPNK